VPLLEKYRHRFRCFNDDIQGTGCVTLAGVIASARNAGVALNDMRFLCAGAGSAGLGVCAQIVDGMVEAGMSREDAMSRFVVCTSIGAIGATGGEYGDPNHKRGLSADRAPWINNAVPDGMPMADVVRHFKPSCLLGLAAQPAGLFTEEMCREMAKHHERPIIMPMSNPTAKAECTPEQATAVMQPRYGRDEHESPRGSRRDLGAISARSRACTSFIAASTGSSTTADAHGGAGGMRTHGA